MTAQRRAPPRRRTPEEVFLSDHYRRHTQRRQQHLASLGLPLAGRSVLEVGAGIGTHTPFFLERGCRVLVTEGRPENLAVLRRRQPALDVRELDLDAPPPAEFPQFQVVYCYGLLYHLSRPREALAFMAAHCTDLLLLETCVSFGDVEEVRPCSENVELVSQALGGTGCRPTRPWVLRQLREHFAHVYLPETQPDHEEFPLDWTGTAPPGLTRAIFIAARAPLTSALLRQDLPPTQTRLAFAGPADGPDAHADRVSSQAFFRPSHPMSNTPAASGQAPAQEPVEIREIRDANGVVIRLEIPPAGRGESLFAMSVHKSGSTLLQGILRILARRAGRPLVALDNQLFQQGFPIAKAPPAVFELWKEPGYTFAGIRSFNSFFDTPEFRRDARKIMLVRDPRDIATSLYFSQAVSHKAPGPGELSRTFAKARETAQAMDINQYVMSGACNAVLGAMSDFTGLLGSQKLNLFRYEDVIFRKREWIEELGRVFQIPVPEPLMKRILDQYDILPKAEDPTQHVRQVKPGNFEKHLSLEAIRYIQDKFATVFQAYRYPLK